LDAMRKFIEEEDTPSVLIRSADPNNEAYMAKFNSKFTRVIRQTFTLVHNCSPPPRGYWHDLGLTLSEFRPVWMNGWNTFLHVTLNLSTKDLVLNLACASFCVVLHVRNPTGAKD